MATSKHHSAEAILNSWVGLLQKSGDVALLVDGNGLLIAASLPALDILGAPATLAGVDVRLQLGLPPGAPFAGTLELPGHRHAEIHCTPIADGRGRLLAQFLLLAQTGPAPEAAPVSVEREQRLREVTLAISGPLDIDEILDRVVRLSIELLDADAGALPLYDAERDRFLPAYMVNLDFPLRVHYRGIGTIWDLIDSGQSQRNNNYAADPRALKSLTARKIHATLSVPVLAGAQVLGALVMYHYRPGKYFSARDQELLEIVGRQAGVAIQNARLYADAVREGDRRALLHKASVSFGAALTTGELYAAIHRAAATLVPCDSFVIGLLDEQPQEIEYVYLADAGRLWPAERAPLARGLLGYVIRTGVSLRVANADDDVDELFGAESFGDGEPSRSIIAVVLTVADTVIGAISVQCARPDAYDADDLDALETLAATAAIAIRNAQLFLKVQELATRDALTGAFNRRHFFELAQQELERSTRYSHPLSLLMLDADYFKQINDSYGHVAGDQVLHAIAARCREQLREADVVARYGGEEFLVLLPETGRPAALLAAERLREFIGLAPVPTEAGPVSVTVSIGVSSLEPGETGSIGRMLDQVDRALYEAKRAGRNQIRLFLEPEQKPS